ncbi:MAG: TetR/AcrR family transcriptional regulator [Algoriphagus aquaeductus]|uniref:TetR/AcrR family transcriptional regulator n=1 Tax=Algoriphagus aquaeductus TaxID=475299 RepID=UPI003919D735
MDFNQDKKTLLLESALELIRENGFHGTPVSMVAKHAGVAAGTVYTYFQSKDEMIKELYTYVKSHIYLEISGKDDPSLPFQARFYALWENMTDLYLAKPSIQSFMDQFVSSPYNTSELQQSVDAWGKWLEQFFLQGIDQGILRPLSPKILSVMVIGSIISLVRYLIYFQSTSKTMGEDLNLIPQMVWDGIKRQDKRD